MHDNTVGAFQKKDMRWSQSKTLSWTLYDNVEVSMWWKKNCKVICKTSERTRTIGSAISHRTQLKRKNAKMFLKFRNFQFNPSAQKTFRIIFKIALQSSLPQNVVPDIKRAHCQIYPCGHFVSYWLDQIAVRNILGCAISYLGSLFGECTNLYSMISYIWDRKKLDVLSPSPHTCIIYCAEPSCDWRGSWPSACASAAQTLY